LKWALDREEILQTDKPDIKQSDRDIRAFTPCGLLGGSGISPKIERTFCNIPIAESCLFSTEWTPMTFSLPLRKNNWKSSLLHCEKLFKGNRKP
jgi:hypothetical protein